MIEWYVISEGFREQWIPRHVVQGRVEALARLTDGMRVTPKESGLLGQFLEASAILVGRQLHLVGYELGNGAKVPDRKLTRVPNPE